MANGNEKTKRTNLELHHCYGENGKNYDYAVIGPASLTSIKEETGQSGVPYVRASVAVSDQSARLNQFLGTNYGNEDTAWISVTVFFGKDGAPGRAGYLLNQIQSRGAVKSVRVILTGTISVNEWTDKKTGALRREAQLTVWGLHLLDSNKSSQNNGQQSGNTQNQGYNSQNNAAQYFNQGGNQAYGYQPQQNGGYQQGNQPQQNGGYQQGQPQQNNSYQSQQNSGYQQRNQPQQNNSYQSQQNGG